MNVPHSARNARPNTRSVQRWFPPKAHALRIIVTVNESFDNHIVDLRMLILDFENQLYHNRRLANIRMEKQPRENRSNDEGSGTVIELRTKYTTVPSGATVGKKFRDEVWLNASDSIPGC